MRKPLALIAVLGVAALAAPWCAPHAPDRQHRQFIHAPPMPPRLIDDGAVRFPFVHPITLADRLATRYELDRSRRLPLPWFDAEPAAPVFLLGTDSLGRDLLSRLLHGARLSLGVALSSVVGALLLGSVIGAFAGAARPAIDEAVMRAADFVIVLPMIYVALTLRALMPLVLSPALVFGLMVGIFTVIGWPFVARGVRNLVRAEREREYVLAAQAAGATHTHILARHLLPACAGFLLVQGMLLLPAFILAEATLSFVGLGFPEHIASWGTMLGEAGNVSALTRFPWTLAPAAAIFAVVLSANVLLRSDRIARRAS